jgi:fructose-1,6-bisphosphatase/inositol monophosphatase family enzyme
VRPRASGRKRRDRVVQTIGRWPKSFGPASVFQAGAFWQVLAGARHPAYDAAMKSPIDIDAVGQLVRAVAAAEIMPHWRNLKPHDIDTKSGPGDLVTIADRRAEAALSRALTALYPGSVVAGEETFAADPDCLAHLDGLAPVWIIDPIDGTGAFTRGETNFGCMVALAHGQELTAAWILQPVTGDLYLGERGGGVRRITADGTATRLSLSPPQDLIAMTGIVSGWVMLDGQRIIRDRLDRQFRQIRHMTCPAIDYPTVLRGEVDFTAYARCLPWDHLPGLMLLSEVGFSYAKLDRSPYRVGDREGGVMCAPTREALSAIRRELLAGQSGGSCYR